MSIQKAFTATKVIETLENYARSDDWQPESDIDIIPAESSGTKYIKNEKRFWKKVFKHTDKYWNQYFHFRNVGLSEWVARVPGLFYYGKSSLIRKLAQSKVEFVSNKWKHYNPVGKTQKVIGGVGSINLPPNENGWYLASISVSNNASTGIPVLISEEVWDHHKLKEGTPILEGKGKWRKMTNSWSQRFPSTNIPKGYLVINNPDDLKVEKSRITPTIYHPFSIMEYEKQNAKFYDFVYVTVDSSDPGFRKKIQEFFGEYKYFENRNGQYLIEPFVHNPLINDQDIIYHSPEELRKTKETKSHLTLMVEKIQDETFKGQTLESIKIAIDNNVSIDKLQRLSDWIQVNPNKWFTGSTVQDESAALIEYCLRNRKLEELVDVLIKDNNRIFYTS